MVGKYVVQMKRNKVIWSVILASVAYFTLSYSFTGTLGLGETVVLAAPEITLEKVREAAYKEGELIWYESSPEGQIAKVVSAFNKRYPKIKFEHVRLRGADTGTRIIAESQANAPTADVGTTGLEILLPLDERGLLIRSNWTELGIPQKLIATPYALISMASIYCLNYNTSLVSEADAPKKWEDVLNPKWKGKIGIWQKPSAIALLAPAWGEERTLNFAKKLAEQKLVFYQSSFPLNDAVAAGEVSVGITIYHTTTAALEKGAPLKLVFVDPTPYEPLCSAIPVKSLHPNAAKLFTAWLLSLEGAEAYERATYRGNPWITGTEAYKLLRGKKLSSFTAEQSKDFADISKKLERILVSR
jgi:iron(III) transport system substrate-binding protein